MPSVIVKNLPTTITSLSDEQLFMRLRAYNIDVGPVLPSTREVYQRKLYSLETGQEVQGYSDYPPADNDDDEEDDDDDEQTIPKVPEPPQPRQRTTATERRPEHWERRRDLGKPSPRKPLHPEVGDFSRLRSSNMAKRAPAATKSKRAPAAAASTGRLRRPVPVLAVVMVVVVIGFLVFLVIKNMESEPVSSIPDEIEMNM